MESEKPHFDLISLNAPGVFGFYQPSSWIMLILREPVERPAWLSEIAGSNTYLLQVLDPNLKEFPETWSIFYIDVRDVALVHVKAAFAPVSAGNQRYLIAGPGVGTNKMVFPYGVKFNSKVREYLIKHYPGRKVAPLSREAAEENPPQIYDTSKAIETFGVKFRGFEEVIGDYMEFVFSYEK